MYRKTLVDMFVEGIVVNPEYITIAYKYNGDNDIIDVPFNLKDSSDNSVRMSLINWSLRYNIRTLKRPQIAFDIKNGWILYTFKRAA